jgi:hypothetical protein
MKTEYPKTKRNGEILKLIADHGPMTIDMLARLTQPAMAKQYIRKTLAILRRKTLIEQAIADRHSIYYQLSQSKFSRDSSKNKLHVPAQDFERPLFRKQEWLHNQWTEYWICLLKRLYPDAEFIRELEIHNSELARRVLMVGREADDLLPDFLLIFRSDLQSEPTCIAFEIERTRKSNQRILQKLSKYINSTTVDGLIYVCDSGRLSETIRLLYQTRATAKSTRIAHYRENFFMFCDSMDGGGLSLSRTFNSNAEPIKIEEWCRLIRETKWTKRRDSDFKNLLVLAD